MVSKMMFRSKDLLINIIVYLTASVALVSTTSQLYKYRLSNNMLAQKLSETRELPPGFQIPKLELLDREFTTATLDLSDCNHNYKVLFIMSPFCKFCRMSTDNWKRLSDTSPGCTAALDITGYEPDVIRDELAIYSFTPYFYMTSVKQLYEMNVKTVPQTILTDSNLKVLHVWTGLLGPASLKDVQKQILVNQVQSSVK